MHTAVAVALPSRTRSPCTRHVEHAVGLGLVSQSHIVEQRELAALGDDTEQGITELC